MLLPFVMNPPGGGSRRRKKVPRTKKKTSRAKSSRGKKKKTRKRTGRSKARPKGKWTRSFSSKGKPRPQGWFAAAARSGAVHKSGPKKGKVMTKKEAMTAKKPVVGFLTRDMIKWWFDPSVGGSTARPGSKRMKEALARIRTAEKKLKELRAKRSSPWRGWGTVRRRKSSGKYKKSGTTKAGRKYKKGQRKPIKPDWWITADGKLKFRRGRGPVTTIKLYRGFSPSKAQIKRLIEGGFAGPMSAAGGKVKLNRPRRRRRKKASSRRRRAPSRKKKSVRRNPRRRKAKKKKRSMSVYNNPRRKRRRKKAVRRNPRRRRRRKKKTGMTKYRRRKKAVRRNPRRRRRRVRRYRRNPGLPAMFQNLKDKKFWFTAAHVVVGMGATGFGSNLLLSQAFMPRIFTSPTIGGAFSRLLVNGAVTSVQAMALGKVAGFIGKRGGMAGQAFQNAQRNLFIGGLAYTLANFIAEIAPHFSTRYLPSINAPTGRRGFAPQTSVEGWGPDYRYGYGGMGSVMSPEDLVAGESLAREVNEFSGMNDWMELSGLGQGGAPVPMEDLRGYPGQYGGGMGDWVELGSNSKIVQQGFDPGAETF
jgi:hypothetical protein